MTRLLFALAAFALALTAPATGAERVKLPEDILGTWCLESVDESADREVYHRADCGPGTGKPSWSWLLMGPDRMRAHELDCRTRRIIKRIDRKLPIYRLTMFCWDEGSTGVDHVEIWRAEDKLMVSPRRMMAMPIE